jgi:Protein of unknown function (DUF3224)
MADAKGEFNVTKWDEQTYEELESGKLTRAEIGADLTGDLAGTARVVWLMSYRSDGTAQYVGYLNVNGTLGGRSGGFVVSSSGDFDGELAAGPWTIIDGSGYGELSGITGAGAFHSPHGGTATYRLSYQLA